MKTTRNWNLLKSLCLFLFGAIIFAGCDAENEYKPSPPPPVTVAHPVQMDVADYLEFTGTTEAFESVEIRARVKGFLQSVHFKEGAIVKKNDLLFKIDPRSFQAQVDQATASVKQAQVAFDTALDTFKRVERLFKSQTATEEQYVQAKAAKDKADAVLTQANALLEDAKLNLEFTDVTSPISGRIGKFEVDVGNLVGDGQSTLLTTVVNMNPIHVYFNISEQELLKFSEEREQKKRSSDKSETDVPKIPLTMALSNETEFTHQGYTDYADYQLNVAAGTFMVRGVFPNENNLIVPGLFVRVRVTDQNYPDAILVNENAFSADMVGRYLYLVNDKKIVEKKYIPAQDIGSLISGMRIVKQGLSTKDNVIINGIQRARDGAEVSPVEGKIEVPDSLLSKTKKSESKAQEKTSSKGNEKSKPVEKEKPKKEKPSPKKS